MVTDLKEQIEEILFQGQRLFLKDTMTTEEIRHYESDQILDLIHSATVEARRDEVKYLMEHYRQFKYIPKEVSHIDYPVAYLCLENRIKELEGKL